MPVFNKRERVELSAAETPAEVSSCSPPYSTRAAPALEIRSSSSDCVLGALHPSPVAAAAPPSAAAAATSSSTSPFCYAHPAAPANRDEIVQLACASMKDQSLESQRVADYRAGIKGRPASGALVPSRDPALCNAAAAAASTPSPPPTFVYYDHFLGRGVLLPVVHHHQIGAPLHLIRTARGRAAAAASLHRPPPHVHLQVSLWPAQRARFMCGLAAAACVGACAAPARVNVHVRTASRWRALILEHVMSGYTSKVQVCFLLECTMFCLIHRAAANTCRLSGATPASPLDRQHAHAALTHVSFRPLRYIESLAVVFNSIFFALLEMETRPSWQIT